MGQGAASQYVIYFQLTSYCKPQPEASLSDKNLNYFHYGNIINYLIIKWINLRNYMNQIQAISS